MARHTFDPFIDVFNIHPRNKFLFSRSVLFSFLIKDKKCLVMLPRNCKNNIFLCLKGFFASENFVINLSLKKTYAYRLIHTSVRTITHQNKRVNINLPWLITTIRAMLL